MILSRIAGPRYRDCARGASAPQSHSMMAVLLAIRRPSRTSTRREEPHAEHVSERGRVSALTMPTWPHGQTILSIMVLLPVVSAGRKKPPVHSPRG
jgi:hypothetical protein